MRVSVERRVGIEGFGNKGWGSRTGAGKRVGSQGSPGAPCGCHGLPVQRTGMIDGPRGTHLGATRRAREIGTRHRSSTFDCGLERQVSGKKGERQFVFLHRKLVEGVSLNGGIRSREFCPPSLACLISARSRCLPGVTVKKNYCFCQNPVTNLFSVVSASNRHA